MIYLDVKEKQKQSISDNILNLIDHNMPDTDLYIEHYSSRQITDEVNTLISITQENRYE